MLHAEAALPKDESQHALLLSRATLHRALACLARARRFRYRGRHLLAAPQVARCKKLLVKILSQEPENLSAQFLLTATLFEEGDFLGARDQAYWILQVLTKSQQERMRDPVLHLAIVDASWRVGDTRDAMAHLLEATKAYPEHPKLCVVLSEILLSLGYQTSAKDMAH